MEESFRLISTRKTNINNFIEQTKENSFQINQIETLFLQDNDNSSDHRAGLFCALYELIALTNNNEVKETWIKLLKEIAPRLLTRNHKFQDLLLKILGYLSRINGLTDQIETWKTLISTPIEKIQYLQSNGNSPKDGRKMSLEIDQQESTKLLTSIPTPIITSITPPPPTTTTITTITTTSCVNSDIKTYPKENVVDCCAICSDECGILINNILQKVLPVLRNPPSNLPIISIEKKENNRITELQPIVIDQLPNNSNLDNSQIPPLSNKILSAVTITPITSLPLYPSNNLNSIHPLQQPLQQPFPVNPHFFPLQPQQPQPHHHQQYYHQQNQHYLPNSSQFHQSVQLSSSLHSLTPQHSSQTPFVKQQQQQQKDDSIVTVHPLVTEFIVSSLSHYILHTFALQLYNFDLLNEELNGEDCSTQKEKLEFAIKTISITSIFLAGKIETPSKHLDMKSLILLSEKFPIKTPFSNELNNANQSLPQSTPQRKKDQSGLSNFDQNDNGSNVSDPLLLKEVLALEKKILIHLSYEFDDITTPFKFVVDWTKTHQLSLSCAFSTLDILASRPYLQMFLKIPINNRELYNDNQIAIAFILTSMTQELFNIESSCIPLDIKKHLSSSLIPFPYCHREDISIVTKILQDVLCNHPHKKDILDRCLLLLPSIIHFCRDIIPVKLINEYDAFLKKSFNIIQHPHSIQISTTPINSPLPTFNPPIKKINIDNHHNNNYHNNNQHNNHTYSSYPHSYPYPHKNSQKKTYYHQSHQSHSYHSVDHLNPSKPDNNVNQKENFNKLTKDIQSLLHTWKDRNEISSRISSSIDKYITSESIYSTYINNIPSSSSSSLILPKNIKHLTISLILTMMCQELDNIESRSIPVDLHKHLSSILFPFPDCFRDDIPIVMNILKDFLSPLSPMKQILDRGLILCPSITLFCRNTFLDDLLIQYSSFLSTTKSSPKVISSPEKEIVYNNIENDNSNHNNDHNNHNNNSNDNNNSDKIIPIITNSDEELSKKKSHKHKRKKEKKHKKEKKEKKEKKSSKKRKRSIDKKEDGEVSPQETIRSNKIRNNEEEEGEEGEEKEEKVYNNSNNKDKYGCITEYNMNRKNSKNSTTTTSSSSSSCSSSSSSDNDDNDSYYKSNDQYTRSKNYNNYENRTKEMNDHKNRDWDRDKDKNNNRNYFNNVNYNDNDDNDNDDNDNDSNDRWKLSYNSNNHYHHNYYSKQYSHHQTSSQNNSNHSYRDHNRVYNHQDQHQDHNYHSQYRNTVSNGRFDQSKRLKSTINYS